MRLGAASDPSSGTGSPRSRASVRSLEHPLGPRSCAPISAPAGVDPATLSPWERNLRVPTGRHALLAESLLERRATDGPA